MYQVSFIYKNSKIETIQSILVPVLDLERALALASMLQKISTPEVEFSKIIVKPLNEEKNETSQK